MLEYQDKHIELVVLDPLHFNDGANYVRRHETVMIYIQGFAFQNLKDKLQVLVNIENKFSQNPTKLTLNVQDY